MKKFFVLIIVILFTVSCSSNLNSSPTKRYGHTKTRTQDAGFLSSPPKQYGKSNIKRKYSIKQYGQNVDSETTENEPEIEKETPAERLKKLDELKDQNLISDEEYQQKRSEILDSI